MINACGTCRYFIRHQPPSAHLGECRRFPPTVHVSYGAVESFLPRVEESDWCGEFSATLRSPSDDGKIRLSKFPKP